MESFNAKVKNARYKPIIRLLEDVRVMVMERIAKQAGKIEKWVNEWSAKAFTQMLKNKKMAMPFIVAANGDNAFQVNCGRDKHPVDLKAKRCSCREWDITGIPCVYVCCAMMRVGIQTEKEQSIWHHRVSYEATYELKSQPTWGKKFWHVEDYPKMEAPPCEEKKVGKPQIVRRKEVEELQPQPGRDPNIYLP